MKPPYWITRRGVASAAGRWDRLTDPPLFYSDRVQGSAGFAEIIGVHQPQQPP